MTCSHENAHVLDSPTRKRRLFAMQDIATLLASEGVTPQDLAPPNPQSSEPSIPKLALSHFDNTDFETRRQEEWVNRVSEVPAEAAHVDKETKLVTWQPCKVVDYRESGNMYEVQWQGSKERTWLPR
jgi:hypothetical protein